MAITTPQLDTHPALTAALTHLDAWIGGPQGVAGAAAAVWHRGRIVAEHHAGEARPGVPVGPDTLFALASVTKPVAAAAVMALVEDGACALDEPAADLLPTFGEPAPGGDPALEARRAEITVRRLLAHTSGLPEDLKPGNLRYADGPDRAALTDAMVRVPLQSAPGAALRYSNAGYATLSRLAEHVAGEDFWDLTRRRVLDPLELSDIVAAPGEDLTGRLAEVADAHHPGTPVETYNSPYWRELAIPWGGLFGTPHDLARFAGAFLPSGAGWADAALSPPTRALMTADHAGGIPGGVESGRVRWPVAHWGLGWEVKGGKRHHWTGDLTSPRTVCHFGQAGTLLWADPDRDLALAAFTNRVVARMWTAILARWVRLSNAVVAAADAD